MTIDGSYEAPRAAAGGADAVTVAFGDPASGLYGLARAGLSGGEEPRASGMALLFAGGEPVTVRAEDDVAVFDRDWQDSSAAGVHTEVVEPLRRWTMEVEGVFSLELEALSEPAVLGPDAPAARAGGMEGYDQLCRVRGTVRHEGAEIRVECLGQRGHSWGRPDWSRLTLARTVSAWLDNGTGLTLTAVRGAKAKHHADEDVAAFILAGERVLPVAEPLLSTTYDDEGRQRMAGLELWVGDDDGYPHRAAGQVVCGTTLDLGAVRMDCAFFRWRMEGRSGVGRYDIVRRAD